MADRETWNERYAKSELVWSAGPNRLFAEVVAGLARGKALDLGCGEGRNALFLAEQGWQVTAIDYSDTGIAKANKLAAHRGVHVDFRVADVLEVTLEPRQYDLVAVVFLHTDASARGRWLPAAIDAVAAGGTLVYIGHDPSNMDKGSGGPQDPSVLPGVDTIVASLDGFAIDRAEVYHRPVGEDPGHSSDGPGVALDALVVAHRQ